MKKIIFVLMPLIVLLAFFGFYLSKDLTFSYLLSVLNEIDFVEMNYESAQIAFNSLDFSIYFSGAENLIDYVVAIFESLKGFFNFILYINKFLFEFFYFMFTNLFTFIRFISNYLFS